MTHEQGWYHDPYHEHEDRYFSDGTPTKLVRDGASETYEVPPDAPMPEAPEPVEPHPSADGEDLRRADEAQQARSLDPRSPAEVAADSVASWGSTS